MSGIRKLATVCSLTAVAAASAIEPVEAATFSSYAYERYHRSLANDYPAIGYVQAIGFTIDGDPVFYEGSCVLITPLLALTAGHITGPMAFGTVQFGNQRIDVRATMMPKAYLNTGGALSNADIGIIRLREKVRGVRPVPTSTQVGVAKGKEIVSVGYGSFGDAEEGDVWPSLGSKRALKNKPDVIDAFSNEYIFDFDGALNNTGWLPSLDFLIEIEEWDDFNFPFLSDPEGPDEFFDPGNQRWEREDMPVFLEAGLGNGDSGGGMFLGNTLVGIHSWGTGWILPDDDEENPPIGRFGGLSSSTDIAQWRRWIERIKVSNFQGSDRGLPFGPLEFFVDDGASSVRLPMQFRQRLAASRGWIGGRYLADSMPAPSVEMLKEALRAYDRFKAQQEQATEEPAPITRQPRPLGRNPGAER